MLPKPMNLLFVDDNLELCDGWRDIFVLDGHAVTCHLTGQSAVADGAAWRACDVLISDYYLPDINGLELLTRMRQERPELPAIILTGSKEVSIRQSLSGFQRVKILFKPLSVNDLEQGIAEVVQPAS